jgi:hypothetical protein
VLLIRQSWLPPDPCRPLGKRSIGINVRLTPRHERILKPWRARKVLDVLYESMH